MLFLICYFKNFLNAKIFKILPPWKFFEKILPPGKFWKNTSSMELFATFYVWQLLKYFDSAFSTKLNFQHNFFIIHSIFLSISCFKICSVLSILHQPSLWTMDPSLTFYRFRLYYGNKVTYFIVHSHRTGYVCKF